MVDTKEATNVSSSANMKDVEVSENKYEMQRLTPRIAKKLAKPLHIEKLPIESRIIRTKWQLSDFVIKRRLGKGNFGDVFRAKERTTGYPVALKILSRIEMIEDRMEEQLKSEIEIQVALSAHKNILRLYGFFLDKKRIYLILELATGGMLHEHLGKQGRFSEPQAAKYVVQIARALQFAHGKKVIHRDLKPENLLLDDKGVIKLADFGWSASGGGRRRTVCGTLDFLAPEIIQNRWYGPTVDIWSLGVVMYEMLYGRPPFEMRGKDAEKRTKERIVSVDYKFLDDEVNVSGAAKLLIKGMLQKNSYHRMSLRKILNDSWIKQYTKNM